MAINDKNCLQLDVQNKTDHHYRLKWIIVYFSLGYFLGEDALLHMEQHDVCMCISLDIRAETKAIFSSSQHPKADKQETPFLNNPR